MLTGLPGSLCRLQLTFDSIRMSGEQVSQGEAVSPRLRGLGPRFTLAIASADQYRTERACAQPRRSGYVATGTTSKYQVTIVVLITLTACPAGCSGLDAACLFQNSERSASTLVLFKTLPRNRGPRKGV